MFQLNMAESARYILGNTHVLATPLFQRPYISKMGVRPGGIRRGFGS